MPRQPREDVEFVCPKCEHSSWQLAAVKDVLHLCPKTNKNERMKRQEPKEKP